MNWWILIILPLLGGLAAVRRRSGAAIGLAGLVAILCDLSDDPLWQATAKAQAPAAAMPAINQLWQAQPHLMAGELGALQPRIAGRANVYAIAVAAQGSQQLFSREAQLALKVIAARFGGDYRGGMLLSNGSPDLFSHPLATQDSLAAAARGIGGRIDPARDLVVVYLVSHGSPEAWIATDLPSETRLPPISAASLAAALSQAGIRRRVVIVSACFAGTWIPALKSDDTIVITAAAEDRTSFGCDDSRQLTFFGEAFLQGPLARGVSLRDAFEAASGTVTKWEEAEQFEPSMPQAFVGPNLRALWTGRRAVGK